MFKRRDDTRALEPPPMAAERADAVEVLRVWAAPGGSQQFSLKTTWEDSAAWGLLLVDISRHVAEAYARDGRDATMVLARIRAAFDAEWSHPTDLPDEPPPAGS
jgi:hypothetical protein